MYICIHKICICERHEDEYKNFLLHQDIFFFAAVLRVLGACDFLMTFNQFIKEIIKYLNIFIRADKMKRLLTVYFKSEKKFDDQVFSFPLKI